MASLVKLGEHFIRDLGTDPFLVVFVCLVAFDYITGVLKAVAWKVGDSAVGLKGLIKHTLVITSVVGVSYIANLYDVHEVSFIVTIMYSINYLISILENFAVMGIYTPKFLITKLKAELKRYEEKLNDVGEEAPDLDEFIKSGKKVKKEETTND